MATTERAVLEAQNASNVRVLGVSFERGTYAVYHDGVIGEATTRSIGLKFLGNRVEHQTAGVIFANADQSSETPPEIHGYQYTGTPNAVVNPNNITIHCTDNPQTLAGVSVFAANTAKSVPFTIDQPSANYVVSLDAPANQPFWVTGKAVNGFTINTTPALTGTVGSSITRLA